MFIFTFRFDYGCKVAAFTERACILFGLLLCRVSFREKRMKSTNEARLRAARFVCKVNEPLNVHPLKLFRLIYKCTSNELSIHSLSRAVIIIYTSIIYFLAERAQNLRVEICICYHEMGDFSILFRFCFYFIVNTSNFIHAKFAVHLWVQIEIIYISLNLKLYVILGLYYNLITYGRISYRQ